jgi:hypothetical protein
MISIQNLASQAREFFVVGSPMIESAHRLDELAKGAQ